MFTLSVYSLCTHPLSMLTILSGAEGTVLPMDAVGWFVTLFGLGLAFAWVVHLYR